MNRLPPDLILRYNSVAYTEFDARFDGDELYPSYIAIASL